MRGEWVRESGEEGSEKRGDGWKYNKVVIEYYKENYFQEKSCQYKDGVKGILGRFNDFIAGRKFFAGEEVSKCISV